MSCQAVSEDDLVSYLLKGLGSKSGQAVALGSQLEWKMAVGVTVVFEGGCRPVARVLRRPVAVTVVMDGEALNTEEGV